MATILADNAYGTLGAGLTATATTLNFTAGHGARFPTVTAPDVLYCCILNSSNILEEVIITSHTSGADSCTITRAAGGTTGKVWNTGDRIEARISSSVLSTMNAATASTATDTVSKTGSGSVYVVSTGATLVNPVISTGTYTGGTFNNPALVSPVLGTATSGVLTNCTGLPLKTGITDSRVWQSLSFAFGATYQNTNAYEIEIAVYGLNGSLPQLQISADNSTWYSVFQYQSGGSGIVVTVPAGHYYRTTVGGGTVSFASVLQ